jgi:hypothetical protein
MFPKNITIQEMVTWKQLTFTRLEQAFADLNNNKYTIIKKF